MNETESVVFYAFVEKQNVDSLFALVDDFNAKQQSISHIHVAVLQLERYN